MWGSGAARSQWRPVKKQEEEGEGEESHEFTLDVPGRERNNKHSRGEGSGEGEGRTFLDGADMAQKQGVKQNISHTRDDRIRFYLCARSRKCRQDQFAGGENKAKPSPPLKGIKS